MENNQFKNTFISDLFRNSSILFSGNVIGQVISLAAYPFLTRIYTKEAFGLFALFISIANVLSVLSTGKYNLAIVLPKEEKKAKALFHLSMILNTVFFIVFMLIMLIGQSRINKMAHFFDEDLLIPVLPLIPFLVLINGYWQTMNYYYIREKKFYNISSYNIAQSGFNSLAKYLAGIKGFIQSGLISGQIIGQFLGLILSAFIGKSSLAKIGKPEKAEIISVAKEYSNLPKYEMPNELVNVLAGNLPVLLLSAYFGMDQVGLFTLALTIGLNPILFFGSSIGQAMFRKMSERIHNHQKLMQECLLFCKICALVILPAFIIILFVPETVFEALFGHDWGKAGFYLKLMLPCSFVSFFVSSFSFVPDVFFRQKTAMNIEIIYAILKVVSLFIGIYFQSFNLAVILYYSTVTFMLGIKFIWYFSLIKKYELSL